MNLLYLSSSYVPSRRASSVQVMKMCQALVRTGAGVTLVTKGSKARQEPGVEDDHAFYGVDSGFEIVKLPRPGVRGGGLVFAYWVRRLLKQRRQNIDLAYARELGGALAAARLGLPVILELHGIPSGSAKRLFHRAMLTNQVLRIVVISRALQELLDHDHWIPRGVEVLLAPDAADALEREAESATRPNSAGGPGHRPSYGYVGQLHRGKAMEVLVPLARSMPGADFHVVGGSREDLARWREAALPENLVLHGFVPPSEIPSWHRRFDALLLPSQREVYGASGRSPIGDVMSPMKLFEYMAAGKPIVCSDLPVLREILRDGQNALLVPPTDIEGWKTALERLASKPSLARALVDTARQEFLDHYTWEARAARVLSGLRGIDLAR